MPIHPKTNTFGGIWAFFICALFLGAFFFVPRMVYAQDIMDSKVCAPGYIQGSVPSTQVPDYSYTSDGFLELHFRLNDPKWKYNFGYLKEYDQNCSLQIGGVGRWDDKKFSVWPGVNHLILRYTEDVYPGRYHFQAFDGDTGLPIALDPTMILGNFSNAYANYSTSPVMRLVLGNRTASQFDWNTETGDLISTPALLLRIKSVRTPVLIIPGVLGTELKKGDELLWADVTRMINPLNKDSFMDPLAFNIDLTALDGSINIGSVLRNPSNLFDYTDDLMNEFVSQGYVEGQDLFTFPYDWRYGASDSNILQLRGQIDYILTQTDAGKSSGRVDIVAHSTGGLLVKKYVQKYSTDHHIRKAVMVGVPNLGAPKAIKVLLQGDNFGVPGLSDAEMKKLAQNMPVVYDLSPSQQYFNLAGTYFKNINNYIPETKDLTFDETNSLLTSSQLANSQAIENAKNLHTQAFDSYDIRDAGINLYTITGCKTATYDKTIYTTSPYTNPQISTSSLTSGDGTVPMISAGSIAAADAHKFYSLKSIHSKLLSSDSARQEIVNLISDSNLTVDKKKVITQQDLNADSNKCKLSGHWWQIFSPLSIEVTDSAGNQASVTANGSIKDDIPGADFEVYGDHKFVFMPTDEGQIYTVNVKGTGDGTFTFRDLTIDNNQITQTQVFEDIPVTTSLNGQVKLTGTITQLALDNDGDGVIDQIISPSITVAGEQFPEVSMQFDQTVKDLRFDSDADNTVAQNNSMVSILDRYGSSTVLNFKQTDRRKALVADLLSIQYNNTLSDFSRNKLSFSWKYDANNVLSSLIQVAQARNGYSIKAVYSNGLTNITGTDQSGKINQTKPGLWLLQIRTNQGDLNWQIIKAP